ncbi:MAG TPA: hypothetical protein VMG12_13465 [Polyangiaceae bacterium]|nr:hypothetical protein [Polyangiaceae bacterium]
MQLSLARLALTGALGVLLPLAACLDLDPLQGSAAAYQSPLVADAQAPLGECESCIKSGVCTEPIAACEADAKCTKVLECVLSRACLELHTQEDAYKCSVPCAYSAGITSSEEPAVSLSVGVSLCGQEQCPDSCYFSPGEVRPM